MVARSCRLTINGVTAFLLLIAVALTIAAITSPQWQVAAMDQVNQLRFIGLYQTCTFGSRQGPLSPAQWVCTFIPYGYESYLHQRQVYMRNELIATDIRQLGFPTSNEIDYNAYGGESWRFASLILMVLGAFTGLLSLAFELIVICFDVMQRTKWMKALSCSSLIAFVLSNVWFKSATAAKLSFVVIALCCIIGMLTFAINSQQNDNLYIMELTAFAIFALGQAFYAGISAMVIFIVTLCIHIAAIVLTCRKAEPQQHKPKRPRNYYEGDGYIQPNNQLFVRTDAWDTLPMLEPPPPQRSIIYPPNKRSSASEMTEMSKYEPYGFQRVHNDVDSRRKYPAETRHLFEESDVWETSSTLEPPPSQMIYPPSKRYIESEMTEMPKFVPYGIEWVDNGVGMEQMILLRERNRSGGQPRKAQRTDLPRRSLSSVLLNWW